MDTTHLNPDKYRLIKALRPFSFSVALITCGLGVALAYSHNLGNVLHAVLVIVAGVFLQAASNLANDHADIILWRKRSGDLAMQVIRHIQRNFLLAGILVLVASAMGLWLVSQVGIPLLWLGVFGVLGGYSYTGEPVNYKQRGWGVPAVFLLTGVLMVAGSYYAVSGEWSNQVMFISIPVSLLASALLLANEIRDYLDDLNCNIRTLTVRIGFENAKLLYAAVLLVVYPLSFYFYLDSDISNLFYLLPSLAFVWQPVRLLFYGPGGIQLVRLPPLTGRFFMIFGVGFICSTL